MTDIKIGGRLFSVLNWQAITGDHLDAFECVVAACELDNVTPDESENNLAYYIRLRSLVVRAGKKSALAALYLLPMGITESAWSQDLTNDTAKFLGAVDTHIDREAVDRVAMEALFGFFRQRLALLTTFPNSTSVEPNQLTLDIPAAH